MIEDVVTIIEKYLDDEVKGFKKEDRILLREWARPREQSV